ncbi:hypothetical protein A28LD_1387, partial [Idiomarina sp. A28L]|uniref:hypothetical protein n=1 Tax=Idiomarina sp. A28L TaxID=1036674 RepID=UPI00021388B1
EAPAEETKAVTKPAVSKAAAVKSVASAAMTKAAAVVDSSNESKALSSAPIERRSEVKHSGRYSGISGALNKAEAGPVRCSPPKE